MEYPEDFVEKVKVAFPDFKVLLDALATGSEIVVGNCLDVASNFSMSPLNIIEAFEHGREQEVLAAAKKAAEGIKLHAEWSYLCAHQ